MKKKILTLLMAVALVVSFIPSLTFADGEGGGTKEISATVKQSVRDEGILGIFPRDYKTEITIKVSLPNDGNPDAKDYINIGGASQNGSDEFRISLVGQKNTEIESVTGVVKSSNRGEEKITLKWDSGTYYYHIPVECISPEVTKLTVTMTHECEYNPAQIKAANCTADGLETGTCKFCKHQKSKVIPALGHDLKEIVFENATCTKAGSGKKDCQREGCNHSENFEIPALDHNYSTKYSSDSTRHWIECLRCGNVIDEAPHSFSEWTVTKEPTYTEEGEKSRTCTVCGFPMTMSISKLVYSREIKVEKKASGSAMTKEQQDADYYVAVYNELSGELVDTQSVKIGESVTFENLEEGKYIVKEVSDSGSDLGTDVGYEPSFELPKTNTDRYDKDSVEADGTAAHIVIIGEEVNESHDVTLTNTFGSKATGEIKVTKKFAGNPTEAEKADTYYVALYKDGELESTAMPISADKSVVFSNLPVGTYTLKEVDNLGNKLSGVNYTPSFTVKEKVDEVEGNLVTVTIRETQQCDTHEIILTNIFEKTPTPPQPTAKVEFKKKVISKNGAKFPYGDNGLTFTFHLLDTEGKTQAATAVVTENNKEAVVVTFDNVPAGSYTLYEEPTEHWTPSIGNGISVTVDDNGNVTFDGQTSLVVTNEYTETSTPVTPVDPPTPVDPKPPVTPVDPTTPTEPTTPDQPDTPDEPDQPTKPDKPAKPGNTDNEPDPADDQKTNDPDQPQTGDESMLYLYLLLAVTASGAIVCIRKMNK